MFQNIIRWANDIYMKIILLPYKNGFFAVLLSLAAICLAYSLLAGSTHISIEQLFSSKQPEVTSIFWQLRLPRTVTAFTAGSLLALAGILMQLLLQNPLADPYALGVASGSSLTILIMMLAGFGGDTLFLGAWGGSLLVMGVIMILGRRHQWEPTTLILSGMAIACSLSAAISAILLIAPDSQLHGMLFWLSGDLNDASVPFLSACVLGVGFIACWLLAPGLNLLNRGEQDAQALGLSIKPYRLILFLLSALFTAAAVSIAGCIGFIGLLVPHLTRLLLGHDYRLLIPASVLLGGSLLTLADTVARTLIAPQQLPVGILTALFGAPCLIGLLRK